MSVSSIVATATAGTSPRITLIGLLPSTILVLFFVFLIFSLNTPPTLYPDLNLVSEKLSSISLEQIAGIVIAITAISLIIEPLQIALLRIFEGYWKREGFIGKIRRIGLLIQLEQLQKYKNQGRGLDEYFPSAIRRFLPTSFGNRLRAAEDMAGNRYGLDTVFFWPRIYPLLPDNMKNIVDDKRNQLDLLSRFCSIFIIATIASVTIYFVVVQNAVYTDFSLVLLSNSKASSDPAFGLVIYLIAFVKYSLWLVIPIVTYALYILSYKSLLSIALSYCKALKVAFDLYRFDLVKSLHWKLSSGSDEEFETNDNLRRFLQNETQGVQYFHGDFPKGEEITKNISEKIEIKEYVEKTSKAGAMENTEKSTTVTTDDSSTSSTSVVEIDTEGEIMPPDTRAAITKFEGTGIRLVGKIILAIGIIVVGIGLVLSVHWIAYFTNSIFTKSITLAYVSLEKDTTMNSYANLTSKDVPSISVYLFTKPLYDTRNELKVLPAVSETITNPLGNKIFQKNFIKQSTYFFKPKPNGIYTLKLVNLANEPIILNGLFGYFPFLSNNGLINPGAFGQLFLGCILLLLGLILILIGILIVMLGMSKAANFIII